MLGRARHLTATGVVFAHACELRRVVVGTGDTGATVTLHDADATGDAGAGNVIAVLDCDEPATFEIGARADVGVVAVVAGGTPDVTVVVA